MPARMSYGGGSITEVRPGAWRLRVCGPGGQRHARTVYTSKRGGRREATDALRKFAAEVQASATPEETSRTFASVMEDWLANLEREGRVAPSTLTLYRSHVTHHILPAMGERDVGDVDARSLDAFYGTLAETLAPSTIRVIHWIVMAALRQAHDWDLLATLPRPRPPRVPHAEREPLTPEQVQALMDAATERNEDAVALLIRLGAVTGARRGELCGLQVSDYDRDARSLAIRRQITGERTITAPKGGKQRTVAIGARTAQAIDDYLAVQRERFRYEHGPWLLSEDGGVTALMPNRVSEAIMRLGRKLKITVTTHALRHYHDSLGVASGVDVVTMAARAGHTPDVAARVYMHRVSSADQRAADVMEGLLVP